ncbi:inosine/xanthosine triphosphatase [Candidatus Woesearchaeota archaeon]|nr:inosine/xanthosine triphosphatase [Candidatus Woesearchaeota archaeon]
MKIIVGSKNPVKVAAIKEAVQEFWKDAEVSGIEIDSTVDHQPIGDEEGYKGALARAKGALHSEEDVDFGIGLEDFCVEIEGDMYTTGWIVMIGRDGRIGKSCEGRILLPDKVANEIRNGGELGPVMDKVTGIDKVKHKDGMVGIVTKGKIKRKDFITHAAILAMARFISEEIYD